MKNSQTDNQPNRLFAAVCGCQNIKGGGGVPDLLKSACLRGFSAVFAVFFAAGLFNISANAQETTPASALVFSEGSGIVPGIFLDSREPNLAESLADITDDVNAGQNSSPSEFQLIRANPGDPASRVAIEYFGFQAINNGLPQFAILESDPLQDVAAGDIIEIRNVITPSTSAAQAIVRVYRKTAGGEFFVVPHVASPPRRTMRQPGEFFLVDNTFVRADTLATNLFGFQPVECATGYLSTDQINCIARVSANCTDPMEPYFESLSGGGGICRPYRDGECPINLPVFDTDATGNCRVYNATECPANLPMHDTGAPETGNCRAYNATECPLNLPVHDTAATETGNCRVYNATECPTTLPRYDTAATDTGHCREYREMDECPTDAPYFDSAASDPATACRLPMDSRECGIVDSTLPIFDTAANECRTPNHTDCTGEHEVFVATPAPICIVAPTFLANLNVAPISDFYTADLCADAGWGNADYAVSNSATQSGAAELCNIPITRDDSVSAAAAATAAGDISPQIANNESITQCIMRMSDNFDAAISTPDISNTPICNAPQLFGEERFPRIPPTFDVATDILTLAIAAGETLFFFNGETVMRDSPPAPQSPQTAARTGGGNGSGGKFIFSGIGLFWAIYSWQKGAGEFNFSPDGGYAFTESGYTANAAGQLNFRDKNLHIYWRAGQQNTNGDFGNLHYESGGKYKKDFWSATFSETITGKTANYDFALSANFQNGIWKISPTYRINSEWKESETGIQTETQNALNLESVLQINRWTISPSAGFRWENAANFANNGKFQINAIYRF